MEKVYFVGETLTYETTIAIDAPFFLMAGGGKERGGRGRCKLGMSVVTGPPNVAHTYLPLHVRGGENFQVATLLHFISSQSCVEIAFLVRTSFALEKRVPA